MTKVAPITDEELTRLERLYEEAREELHEEEESGETNSTIARCLFHDESWERFLSLLSRLRAAEARAEKAERVLARIRSAAADASMYLGCGDNSCLFIKSRGMATNGGCRCIEDAKPGVRPTLGRLFRAAHVTGAKNEGKGG